MTRDIPDIPTIFNPRRNRTPSVLITDDGIANGPSAFVHNNDAVSSQQDHQIGLDELTFQHPRNARSKLRGCVDGVCSTNAKKIYYGVWVTICVTASWNASYDAPFFTTWFITNWTMLFFPLYFICRLITSQKCDAAADILIESIRDFREKGFTVGHFLTRCSLFCLLWVATNYMYIRSLKILYSTDVMALYATNVSCVYLLSWVILHEQFVGIRIMAVIMCDTGVALLAYMDGITGSPTLGGVVLAASAAAAAAVYKVLFKKVIGDATYGQIALFFSLVGMLNAALLWPLCLGLFLTGFESLHWDVLPWPVLLAASLLSLIANLLGNFSVALTYDLFITLGLITAVPVSAALDVILYGAKFEGMKLAGMILIGVGFFLVMFPDNWPDYITRLLRNIIMLTHTTRWSRRNRYGASGQQRRDIIDYRTGYIRSHLRSPSGRVR